MWKNSCLVQNAEAKELCNCRLVEPLFPTCSCARLSQSVHLPTVALTSHGQLTPKAPSPVTLPPPPPPPPAATQFPALRMWPAVKLSQSSFLPVFSVVSLSFGAFATQQYCQKKKKKFSGTKVKSPYYLTTGIWVSYGKEGDWEGSCASVLRRKEFASW